MKDPVADMLSQLHRQFALAQYLYNNISEEDKDRLLFDPDTGRWSGYKHPYGFKVRDLDMPNKKASTDSNSASATFPMESNSSTGTIVNGKTSTGSRHACTLSWMRSKLSATISPSQSTGGS